MADNSSSSVAIVAIIIIVLLALGGYYFFMRTPTDTTRIEVQTPAAATPDTTPATGGTTAPNNT